MGLDPSPRESEKLTLRSDLSVILIDTQEGLCGFLVDKRHGTTSMRGETKRSLSLRLDTTDFSRVRAIARRLQVRESEVFRFAIKMALARLAPLDDPKIKGRSLMPIFVDLGRELIQHFNLDRDRLNALINGDLDDERQADAADVELVAAAAHQENYLHLRLRELWQRPVELERVEEQIREYLLDKYVRDDQEDAEPERKKATA